MIDRGRCVFGKFVRRFDLDEMSCVDGLFEGV